MRASRANFSIRAPLREKVVPDPFVGAVAYGPATHTPPGGGWRVGLRRPDGSAETGGLRAHGAAMTPVLDGRRYRRLDSNTA